MIYYNDIWIVQRRWDKMSENIMNLPLSPLRGISVFHKMVIHFDIVMEKSKAAIEAAENQSEIF